MILASGSWLLASVSQRFHQDARRVDQQLLSQDIVAIGTADKIVGQSLHRRVVKEPKRNLPP
jgi:hypothetical protein